MRAVLIWLAGLYACCTGCGLNVYNAMPRLVPVDPSGSAISRALAYLELTQVTVEEESQTGGDFAGNWPQYFMAAALPEVRVRDVSPFMAAFVHHGLSLVSEEHMAALQLLPGEVERARAMRRDAIAFMRRFQAPAGDPAAGTIGFWPGIRGLRTCQEFLLAAVFLHVLGGPQLMGGRSPVNLTFYPPPLAIPTDADDTAMVYSAFLDDVRIDGGALVDPPLDRFFTDWRDLGQVPRRANPAWLPPASGAFLTWLAYKHPPGFPTPNDVDLVVNANVLFVLGRYGYTDLPGVTEAVALIHAAVLAGYHDSRPEDVSLYYPPNYAFHYCVSRAYAEGAIEALAPAVERLADELEASVQRADDGCQATIIRSRQRQLFLLFSHTKLVVVSFFLFGSFSFFVKSCEFLWNCEFLTFVRSVTPPRRRADRPGSSWPAPSGSWGCSVPGSRSGAPAGRWPPLSSWGP